jgi:hypothetical protein
MTSVSLSVDGQILVLICEGIPSDLDAWVSPVGTPEVSEDSREGEEIPRVSRSIRVVSEATTKISGRAREASVCITGMNTGLGLGIL